MSFIDDETIRQFVPNIKHLRQAAGWTQQELADKIGVKRQTITAIETGKVIPSVTLFLAIIGLFAVGSALLPIVGGVANATGLVNIFKKILKD